MRRIMVLALVAVVALGILGFAQELGTKDRPIRLILVPSTNVAVVQETGEIIAQALYDLTGLWIEAYMTPDTAAAVEEVRAAEGDVFAFLSTKVYVQAYEAAGGLDFRLVSVRQGYTAYWSGFYARRDSGIGSILDLEGKKWGYAYPGSSSGYQYPNITLAGYGIVPGDTLETGSHNNSMVAVYEGDVDFCTGYFSAPKPPLWVKQMGLQWEEDMYPELGIWDPINGELYTGCCPWEVKDLRLAVMDSYPDILEKVGVVGISDSIPNDGVSFVLDFPEDLKEKIIEGLLTYIHSIEGRKVFGNPQFYEWDDLYPAGDEIYDVVRKVMGISIPER